MSAIGDNHSVVISWDDESIRGDVLRFVLQYKAVMKGGTHHWRKIEISDVNATTYTVDDLVNYQRYAFRLRVQGTRHKRSSYSRTVFATPADATLRDLRVSGETVTGFAPDTLTYDVVLPFGTIVAPEVTATANDDTSTVTVTEAPGLPGSATVTVTARKTKDTRVRRTYAVRFAVSAGVTVTFDSNGGEPVAPISRGSGAALGTLPVPNRADSIFLGWYTDDDTFEQAVSEETPVTADLTLHARWAQVSETAATEQDAFASAMDCPVTFAIQVRSSDGAPDGEEVKAALRLEVLDDTPLPGLSVTDEGGGVYTVTATDGYTPGASYKLALTGDSLSFAGEPESVRTYCFTIAMQKVLKVSMDPLVKMVPATDITKATINGSRTSSLSVPLAEAGDDVVTLDDAVDTGTFTYEGTEPVAVGDVMAIYEGTPPDERTATGDYYGEGQSVAYVEVTAVNDTTVTYKTADAEDVVFTPDVLPVSRTADTDGDPDDGAITVPVAAMTYTGADYESLGLSIDTVIEKDDFLAFYDGAFGADAEDVSFATITAVTRDDATYTIHYAVTTDEQLALAMDLYSSHEADFPLPPEEAAAAEEDIERQAVESGFAQTAGDYLASLAFETEEVQRELERAGLDGPSRLTPEADGDGLTVTADIYSNLTHFTGLKGIGCSVVVDYTVKYEDSVTIVLSATFTEELRTALSASGGAVWKRRWIFPYIADYRLSSSLDLYNYTGVMIEAKVTSGGEEFDVASDIKEMLAAQTYQPDEVATTTQSFYELYGEMLDNQHGYINLFTKRIYTLEGTLDPLHITAYRLSFDFVVNADVNVSLGCRFEYEKATRYIIAVRLWARTATSDQLELVDEKYGLEFWVMGELGLRVGLVSRFELGLISCSAGSVGIEIETGPYARLWGYFYYHLEHANDQTTSTTSGALYTEIGIYLHIRFLAQAIGGKYSYNPTLYEKEFPLWSVGSQTNVYDFAYKLTDATDDIRLKGSTTTCTLPSTVFSMKRLDLKEGDISVVPYGTNDFNISFTNAAFSQTNGVITVQRPAGQDIAEGFMTVRWKGGPLSFTTVPISRTYHVVWDDLADSYLLSFDSRGGGMVSPITGAYGSTVTLPTPARAGYDFGGWYDNAACTGAAFTATTMPAANTLLYAKWTPRTDTAYTVRHYVQEIDGSWRLDVTEPLTGTTGTQVTPDVAGREGFTAPRAQSATIKGDGSTVVEYFYSRNSYSLTFTPRNGDPEVVRSVMFGGDVTAPQVVWAGHIFDGWYDNVAGTGEPWAATTMPAADVHLYGAWTTIVAGYTVRHYLQTVDGSTYDLTETQALAVPAGEEVTPAANSYTGFTSPAAQTVAIAGDGSTVVRYYYTRDSYTLTFKPRNGEPDMVSTVAFGATIHGVEVSWTDTAFTGWYTDQTLTTLYAFDTMPAGPLTLYAGWVSTAAIPVTIGTELSTGADATVTVGSFVNDTITLTWDAPAGVVPTGTIHVTMLTPGGDTWDVCDQVVEATTSPYTFTTTDQGLSEVGVYQFEAEYIPDAASLFAGAVSDFEDEQVTVLGVPALSTQLDTGEDGTVPSPTSVHATVTLTWDAPGGVVPAGTVRVTGVMPDGHSWIVMERAVTSSDTSPFSFTTTGQVLGSGAAWEGGLLGPGFYQLRAEYLPAADSLFVGAASEWERVTCSGSWTESGDVPADWPGVTLPASTIAGNLADGDLADLFTVVLGPGDRILMTLGSGVSMWFAQLELRRADGGFIDETDYLPENRVIDYTVPPGASQAGYMVRMEHLSNTAIPADYDFTCEITQAD